MLPNLDVSPFELESLRVNPVKHCLHTIGVVRRIQEPLKVFGSLLEFKGITQKDFLKLGIKGGRPLHPRQILDHPAHGVWLRLRVSPAHGATTARAITRIIGLSGLFVDSCRDDSTCSRAASEASFTRCIASTLLVPVLSLLFLFLHIQLCNVQALLPLDSFASSDFGLVLSVVILNEFLTCL